MRICLWGLSAAAFSVGAAVASPGYAAPVITERTTCQKIIGYTLSEGDVPALQRSIGKVAGAIFAHYGLPEPKNPGDFGMNVGLECMSLPPHTSLLEAANKVRGYWKAWK